MERGWMMGTMGIVCRVQKEKRVRGWMMGTMGIVFRLQKGKEWLRQWAGKAAQTCVEDEKSIPIVPIVYPNHNVSDVQKHRKDYPTGSNVIQPGPRKQPISFAETEHSQGQHKHEKSIPIVPIIYPNPNVSDVQSPFGPGRQPQGNEKSIQPSPSSTQTTTFQMFFRPGPTPETFLF